MSRLVASMMLIKKGDKVAGMMLVPNIKLGGNVRLVKKFLKFLITEKNISCAEY